MKILKKLQKLAIKTPKEKNNKKVTEVKKAKRILKKK